MHHIHYNISCALATGLKNSPLISTAVGSLAISVTFKLAVLHCRIINKTREILATTVRRKFLTGKILTDFQQFVNIFPIKIFHLVSYSVLMIGIRQNFPNPADSSKFSTVKILRHTVSMNSSIQENNTENNIYYGGSRYTNDPYIIRE